ncbi:MAG TPA: protein kinase [Gemmatimonadales bacterium]|nr:protein kinase [Gemmatimonadales bacterium]
MTIDLRERLRNELADRYRIERELGRGGMATVYLAQDLKHERPVALKVLHPELAATLGPERFLREVRTTARLQHPHILPVLDSGEAAGQLWYTMPYVRGESLRDRLRREAQLPLHDAMELARQTALALDYAHREGVIHRDFKPENILLSEGQALVADFGVAKALAAGSESRLTETGMAVGTPAYMSPEQAGGGPVDGRSDIYALGCVLYEMLTGEPPFTGPTPQAILAKRVLEPVPHVRTLRESVPEPLEQAVTRALAKAPADRFANAAEFAQALQPTAAVTAATPAARAGRRMPVPAMALAVGLLIGLGVLFAWRRSHGGVEETGGVKVLAVLPFENLGDSTDAYFADGVTDAIRGKLTSLPGLEVIASNSSGQYRRTSKSPQQIARELGVDYLLVGKVRWEKRVDSTSRVQVSPELIQGSSAAAKWQEPFEAPLTDVFQVQADVAARVAEALGLALGASQRERLAERPTENLAAYDAFLKGEEAISGDLAAQRRAVDYYERAVALDSTFALAWAQLSRARGQMYWVAPTAAGAAAMRRAAERALALAPKLPEGYFALAFYYYSVQHDVTRALEQSTRAWQLRPKDAQFLVVVAQNELDLGHTEEGLKHLREVQMLDPRSVETATRAVHALVGLRRYREALEAAERGLALAPADIPLIHAVVEAHLAQGDLAGGQAVLRAVPREVDPAALVAYVATLDDLYWVLDDAQQRLLLQLSPAPFGDDRATWGIALAETHALRGDTALARAYADSARIVLKARLRDVPQDAVTHAYLGLALAYMGRKADAIREGERALALPISMDLRGDFKHLLARIYVLVGKREKALDLLEPLLQRHYISPGWLKIDPTFDPLRGNPRFERLVNGR